MDPRTIESNRIHELDDRLWMIELCFSPRFSSLSLLSKSIHLHQINEKVLWNRSKIIESITELVCHFFCPKMCDSLFDGREFIFLDLLWSNSIPKWFDLVLSIRRRLTLQTSNTAFFFAYENEFKSIWPTEAFAFDFTFNPSCSKFFFS